MLFSPEIKWFCMLLHQGKKEMFCYMGCFRQKKKEVGRCITVRNSPTISAPQRQTGYVSPLSLFQDSFWIILEFEFFLSCFGLKGRMSFTPLPPSILGLWFRESFPGLSFHLSIPSPITCHPLALSDTQENIYWLGKLIKNHESHKCCVSAHLILGVTKWLTLANELCKWKWQYISLG